MTPTVVKLNTSGTLPTGTTIGGISAVVTYPNVGLTIASSDVSPTGSGAGSNLAPNVNTAGKVTLGLINVPGIRIGVFATLIFHVAVGIFPSLSAFTIAPGATDFSSNGTAISGISVKIGSVTLQ